MLETAFVEMETGLGRWEASLLALVNMVAAWQQAPSSDPATPTLLRLQSLPFLLARHLGLAFLVCYNDNNLSLLSDAFFFFFLPQEN